MKERWIIVFSGKGSKVDIIKNILESEGIPVMVQQGAIGILYSSSELSETKILVPFSFKEKVLEILSFYEKYPKDKNEENNNE